MNQGVINMANVEKKKKAKILTISGSALALIIIAFIVIILIFINTGTFLSYHVYTKSDNGDIRIACVGDSITYGATVNGWRKNAYPFVLDRMLGSGYNVNDYGHSGTTALMESDFPYYTTKTFQKSLTFEPDIVIIMFGTNDSKTFNWIDDETYIEQYEALISMYQSLKTEPEIYIMIPPSLYAEPWGMQKHLIDNNIASDILTIATEKHLNLIDLRIPLNNHRELFAKDGCHPNKDGAKLLAETVYNNIKK